MEQGERAKMLRQLIASFEGSGRLMNLEAKTARQLVEALPKLSRELATYSKKETLRLVGALCAFPDFLPQGPRLQTLIQVAAIACNGSRAPKRQELVRWLNVYLRPAVAHLEDPVEDAAVGNVYTQRGSFEILLGTASNADVWIQDAVDVLALEAQEREEWRRILMSVEAALRLGRQVVREMNLGRYATSGGSRGGRLSIPSASVLSAAADALTFSPERLARVGVRPDNLENLTLDVSETSSAVADTTLGESQLNKMPFLMRGDDLILYNPSEIGESIRMLVADRIAEIGEVERFDQLLADRQLAHVRDSIRSLNAGFPTPEPRRLEDSSIFEFVSKIDSDIELRVLFFSSGAEPFRQSGSASYRHLDSGERSLLDNYMESLEGSRGLLVLVAGGLGQGYSLSLDHPGTWLIMDVDAADIRHLATFHEASLLRCWKLLDHVHRYEIHMFNACGFLALFERARSSSFNLLPSETDLNDPAIALSQVVDVGFVGSCRSRARLDSDRHAVIAPYGATFVPVRRLHPDHFLEPLRRRPIYFSREAAAVGSLAGCVEAASGIWWVLVADTAAARADLERAYRLWDAALEWLWKIGKHLEDADLPGNTRATRLVFELEIVSAGDPLAEGLDGADGDTDLKILDAADGRHRVQVGPRFFEDLSDPSNIAEKRLVDALLGVVAAGLPEVTVTVEDVVPDTGARSLHAFPVLDVRDLLRRPRETAARMVQAEDWADVTRRLAFRVGDEYRPGSKLTGSARSSFLNGCVDVLWGEIRQRLGRFSKRDLIVRALELHEDLRAEAMHWSRTARALLSSVPDNHDAVIDAAGNRETERTKASVAVRTLVEMSVCCGNGSDGAKASQAELDSLLAQTAFLLQCAYYSDAVRYDLFGGVVAIEGNGDFSGEFAAYEEIIEPFMAARFSRLFNKSAAQYQELFADRGEGSESSSSLDSEFETAFESEFGLAPLELGAVARSLAERAAQQNTRVVETTLDELVELSSREVARNEEAIRGALERLMLWPRPKWEQTPSGFLDRDWYPWRTGRRLSLLSRPLVRLEDRGQEVVFAPAGLVDTFEYLVGRSFTGRLPTEFFATDQMKAWVGGVVSRDGLAFNEEVAGVCRAAGISARSDIQMTSFGAPSVLGDVDVLAWDNNGNVAAVECKNLRPASTIGEIGEQLDRFRGEEDDELGKHLKRIEWLSENLDAVGNATGMPVKSLHCVLVMNARTPVHFVRSLAVPSSNVLTIDDVAKGLQEIFIARRNKSGGKKRKRQSKKKGRR